MQPQGRTAVLLHLTTSLMLARFATGLREATSDQLRHRVTLRVFSILARIVGRNIFVFKDQRFSR